ncbi:MAG: glycosyltransferase family 39 protein [Burkholderiaceae bacterium]|jgi:4-amino-4-deoxy-L-arabinose transferase-like glycosyltransferase|nr:glycosyltransferase family 39 protein [Burkholderiaceae bacterium]
MPSAFPPPAPPPAARRGWDALYARPLPWLALLAAAHVAVRLVISPALRWDEAEQILWSQQLQWGYGPQPPLYTWLQWGVNQALGPSVPALALLKHALIVLTCVFMWLAARELLNRRGAWWVAGSLFLLPFFGWYAINDLTHTILVTAMTCAAWWLLLRIVRRQGRDCLREFAALGLVCGCGLLAKYSFALLLAALLAALLSAPEPRRALLARGWWWTPLIALLLAAPHGGWVLSHWHTASASTLRKMEIAAHPDWSLGLLNLLAATLATLTLWALAALAAFGSGWWRRPSRAPEPLAWLGPVFRRYLALLAVALLILVFAAGVTAFKDRWLAPLLAPVPLMAFALRPELQADPRGHRFTGLALAAALAMLAADAAQPWFSFVDGKPHPVNYPVEQLGQALRGAGYDGQGHIIATDALLAGILRTRFPAALVAACRQRDIGDVAGCVAGHVQTAERARQGWLLISYADRLEGDWWKQALAQIPDSGSLPRGNLRIPYRTVRRGQPPASYDFIWQPAR